MLNGMVCNLKNLARSMCVVLTVSVCSGCATAHYVKMNSDFKQKNLKVETIGCLLPIEYVSNRAGEGTVLQAAVIDSFQGSSPYRIKLIRKEDFSQWDDSVQKVASKSRELLRDIELEGLWKDKKTDTISRKFCEDIKAFKTLDPELDAVLVIKCNQHYGNAWKAGLCAFGALGGLVAAATADKDPVIGAHDPIACDAYSSAILVDLNTTNILWYNFALKYGFDVSNKKHAKVMAKDLLYGLVD